MDQSEMSECPHKSSTPHLDMQLPSENPTACMKELVHLLFDAVPRLSDEQLARFAYLRECAEDHMLREEYFLEETL